MRRKPCPSLCCNCPCLPAYAERGVFLRCGQGGLSGIAQFGISVPYRRFQRLLQRQMLRTPQCVLTDHLCLEQPQL